VNTRFGIQVVQKVSKNSTEINFLKAAYKKNDMICLKLQTIL